MKSMWLNMFVSDSGADELTRFSALPQSTAALPSSHLSPSSIPQKEHSSAVGVTGLETAEVLPDAQSTTPASYDGPPLTQTGPSSASTGATVGFTIVLENSECTGSSASRLQPTATTSKDITSGPLLQELLTTLVPASSDADWGVMRDDIIAGVTTNDPSAVTLKPGKTTSKAQDKPSSTKPVSVTQGANTDEMSNYQAGRKDFHVLCCSFAAKQGGLTYPSNCSCSVMKCWRWSFPHKSLQLENKRSGS